MPGKYDSAQEQGPVLQEPERLEKSVKREAGWLPFLYSLLEGWSPLGSSAERSPKQAAGADTFSGFLLTMHLPAGLVTLIKE